MCTCSYHKRPSKLFYYRKTTSCCHTNSACGVHTISNYCWGLRQLKSVIVTVYICNTQSSWMLTLLHEEVQAGNNGLDGKSHFFDSPNLLIVYLSTASERLSVCMYICCVGVSLQVNWTKNPSFNTHGHKCPLQNRFMYVVNIHFCDESMLYLLGNCMQNRAECGI